MHLAIIAALISGLHSMVTLPGAATKSRIRLRKRTFPAKGKSNTGVNATGTVPMQPRLQSSAIPTAILAYAVPDTQYPQGSRFSRFVSNRLSQLVPKVARGDNSLPVATPIFENDDAVTGWDSTGQGMSSQVQRPIGKDGAQNASSASRRPPSRINNEPSRSALVPPSRQTRTQGNRPTSSLAPKAPKSDTSFAGSSQARLPKSARRPDLRNNSTQDTRPMRQNVMQSSSTTLGSPVYQICSDRRLIGKVLQRKYRINRYLGKHGNRIFYSASYNGEFVAVECSTANTQEHLESLIDEVRSHSIINHENILKIKDGFREFGLLFKVTEHWELDLPKLVEIFDPDFEGIKSTMLQVLEGVIYIHGLNEAHRNLHPASVKIKSADDHTVKIADMGIPIWSGDFYYGSYVVGERGYISPELLSRQMGPFWIKNDVWALGIMMFKLMTKTLPWGDITDWYSISSIVNNFQRDYGFSDDKVEFFRKVFVEADSRPTASEMKQMLLQLD